MNRKFNEYIRKVPIKKLHLHAQNQNDVTISTGDNEIIARFNGLG
jgi:hypothetical protein